MDPEQQQQQAPKKKVNPFGDAKPRELTISAESEERLAKKFQEIDLQRESILSAPKTAHKQNAPQQPQQPQQPQLQLQPQQPQQPQQRRQLQDHGNRPLNNPNYNNYNNQGQGAPRYNNNQGQRTGGQGGHRAYDPSSASGSERSVSNNNMASFLAHNRVDQGEERDSSRPSSSYNSRPQGDNYRRPPPPQQQSYNSGNTGNRVFRSANPPPPEYLCKICLIPGHWIKECPYGTNNSNNQHQGQGQHRDHSHNQGQHREHRGPDLSQPPKPGYVCRICEKEGHWIQHCPDYQQKPRNSVPPDTYTCRLCNVPGHWLQNCAKFDPDLRP